MRTTLNIPDELVIAAKMRALSEKTTLTELMVQGLANRLEQGKKQRPLPVSRAKGGLVPGIEWEDLSAADAESDTYR